MNSEKGFVAANKYEGCGHLHRSKRAAARCLRKVDWTGWPGKGREWRGRIYRVLSALPYKAVPV